MCFAKKLIGLFPQPTCLIDEDLSVCTMNDAWCQYYGLATGPLALHDLVSPDDRLSVGALVRTNLSRLERIDCECRLLGQGQASKWFSLTLQPFDGWLDAKQTWICTATDIDRLKRQEIEVRRLACQQTEMLNISVDCIKLISLQGNLLHMNQAGCLALGVSADSGFGMEWLPLLPEDVWACGQAALANARNGQMGRFPGRSELPGMKPQHWDNMLTPVCDSDGQVQAILCVSREVTAEREAQDALRQSQERLAIATRVGQLGIWDYDLKNDALHCDEQWYKIMGRDQVITSIQEFRPFIHPDDVDMATSVEPVAADIISKNGDYDLTFRIIRPDGSIRRVRSTACIIQDMAGVPERAVGFISDITDSWQSEVALKDANAMLSEEKAILAQQSLEDPLTGLANRRALYGRLSEILQDDHPTSILMIDVDYFKLFNDTYGHLEGDRVLLKISEAFRSVSRSSDCVARYGGEEFVFALPQTADPESFLERLFQAIEALAIAHDVSPFKRVSISCGCVVFEGTPPYDSEECLRLCDQALYEAKASGRNRSSIHRLDQAH